MLGQGGRDASLAGVLRLSEKIAPPRSPPTEIIVVNSSSFVRIHFVFIRSTFSSRPLSPANVTHRHAVTTNIYVSVFVVRAGERGNVLGVARSFFNCVDSKRFMFFKLFCSVNVKPRGPR